jgi:hypothetical protein
MISLLFQYRIPFPKNGAPPQILNWPKAKPDKPKIAEKQLSCQNHKSEVIHLLKAKRTEKSPVLLWYNSQ